MNNVSSILANAATSQVKVPREFFAKSKLEYSDWRWAYFRELIQNSYDAGATQISFDIQAAEDNQIKISCADNGCGMDRNTLINVLLALGGSKKPDGSIGGFGYAKSLLFFAHNSYYVRTQNWFVAGTGGDYELKGHSTFVDGTSIVVKMDAEGMTAESFADILKRYVSYLMLPRPLTVLLNGVELKTQFNDFEYNVDTQLGSFSFKEIEGTTAIVIAVRGLPMFVQRVWSTSSVGFSGLLELSGDSLELLTANRDALKGRHADTLNRIIQRMVEDRHMFKAGTTIDITLNFSDPIALERATSGMSEQQALLFKQQAETVQEELRYLTNEQFPSNFQLRLQNIVGRGGKDRDEQTITVSSMLDVMKKAWVKSLALAWKFTTYAVLASEYGKKIGVKYYRNDGTLVEENIMAEDFEQGAFYTNGVRISSGFIFSKDAEGLNVRPHDGSDIMIMLNPTLYDKTFSVGDLLDLAIHECSHLIVSGHGEVFSDVDMKFRRSFRRVMNEIELRTSVKEAISVFKSRFQ